MNKSTNRTGVVLFTVLFGMLLVLSVIFGCGTGEEIQLGAILPMTGGGAQYGQDALRGMEIAVDELNAKGGINGKPLKLTLEDSQTEPRSASLAFRKMIAANKVQIVLTEVSGVVLALAPEADEQKVVLFNIGAQNPEIRDAGPFVFSNINDATVESRQIADFAFDKLGAKTAGILYSDAAYGVGAKDVFSNRFRELGGEILTQVSFSEDALDFRSQILEVKTAQPDVVFLPGLTKDMAKILKQSFEMDYNPQWLSYTAFEGEDIIRIAGKAAEGVIYSHQSFDANGANPTVAHFVAQFKAKYGVDPGIYSATSYDGIMISALAIDSVGYDAERIREFFLRMSAFDGASGVTKFLPNGAVEKALVFKTVKDGEFVNY